MTGKKSLMKNEGKKVRSCACMRQQRFYAWGQHAPEKIEETEHLDQHTDSWPFEEDEEYPTEEADCPAQLVLAREKVERLLRADDEEEAT
jgi:hypothetical protein